MVTSLEPVELSSTLPSNSNYLSIVSIVSTVLSVILLLFCQAVVQAVVVNILNII
jgi:hypothetical protein